MSNLILKWTTTGEEFEIKDELFPGLLTGTFYTLGRKRHMDYTILNLKTLVETSLFPPESKTGSRMLPFIAGANPELYKQIKFYF